MARDAESIKIRPWATDAANRQDPEDVGIDRAAGWDVRYEQIGGEYPGRLVFNQLLHELTTLFHALNTGGLVEWSNQIDYVHTADGPISFVRGSNGFVYRAVAPSGPALGNASNPVTDDGTLWRRH